MKIETTGEKINTIELLPQIVERIFFICKQDPNFSLKDELEITENKILEVKQKIDKQDNLLTQSNELIKNLKNRITILDEQNSKKQIELLESLGSEL